MPSVVLNIDTESIDAIREQDFHNGDWLLDLDSDYGEYINSPGAHRQINWEEMYAPIWALWDKPFREQYISKVEAMWKKGTVDSGCYIVFNKVNGPKTGISYTVIDKRPHFKPYYGHGNALLWVNYNCPASSYFNGGKRYTINFSDPKKEYLNSLRDCIKSMHVDLYNTYKAVKATGDKKRLVQMFGRATAGCLNEKYRSFEVFLAELHKGYKFATIVEMILTEYTKYVCIANNWPEMGYNQLAQKDDGQHFYLEDITEYAIKYHGSTISAEGNIVHKDFESTAESWAICERRPPPTILEASASPIKLERLVKHMLSDFLKIESLAQARAFKESFDKIGPDPVFNLNALFQNPGESGKRRPIAIDALTFELRCSLIARLVNQELLTNKIEVLDSNVNNITLYVATEKFAWSWIEEPVKGEQRIKREPLLTLETQRTIQPPTIFNARTLMLFAANNNQNKLLRSILQGQFLTRDQLSSLTYIGGENLLWVCLQLKNLDNLVQLLDNGITITLSNSKNAGKSLWALAKNWKEQPIYAIFLEHLFTGQLKIIVNDPKDYDVTDLVEFIKSSKTLGKIKLGEFAKLLDCNGNAKQYNQFFAELLFEAVVNNDFAEVEVLLGINAPLSYVLLNSKYDKYYGYGALHVAVARERTELALMLLLANADPLKPVVKQSKVTPLSLALDSKNSGLFILMLQYIFEPEAASNIIKQCFDENNIFDRGFVKCMVESRLEAERIKHKQAKVFPAQESAMKAYYDKFPQTEEPAADLSEEACMLCNGCAMF